MVGESFSKSIATTAEDEEDELELLESDKAYENDARVIHKIMARQHAGVKRQGDEQESHRPQKRGTLLS